MARLAAIFDQEPPFEHDVFGDREHALLEHRPYLVREPIVEFGAATGIGEEVNAESNFSKAHRAHIKKFERLGGDECEDFVFWPGAAQFGQDIGVEQPTRHKETLRTGIGVRLGSISISRCGEACIAAISDAPVRSPLRRRNSSAEITTTSSRPCTVTRCGPSLRTRRTSSLKRTFASCNSHWPDLGWRVRRRGFNGFDGDDFTILVMLTSIYECPWISMDRLAQSALVQTPEPARSPTPPHPHP